MSNAIVIRNSLPETIVALDEGIIAQVRDAIAEIDHLATCYDGAIQSPDEFERASAAYKAAHDLEKSIEKARKVTKAPILELGKALDRAAEAATAPLATARTRISGLLADWHRKENARVERERAEARRIEAERLAKLREIEAEQLKAALLERPVETTTPIELPAPAPMIEDAPKSVVRMVKHYSVEIFDVDAIPVYVRVGDTDVRVLEPDVSALREALKAGAEIPGCKLVIEERPAAIGR